MAAALLYAGPGAALSHEAGAWWRQLLSHKPDLIDVRTPRRRGNRGNLRIHQLGDRAREWHNRLPTVSIPELLLELASYKPLFVVRKALSEAEFQGVDIGQVREVAGRGKPGSARLRRALAAHLPELARTRSELEDRFLLLCDSHLLPRPEVNVEVAGLVVDSLWRQQRLVVELDGVAGHSADNRVQKDRERELALEEAGFRVKRFSWHLIVHEESRVAALLRALLFETD